MRLRICTPLCLEGWSITGLPDSASPVQGQTASVRIYSRQQYNVNVSFCFRSVFLPFYGPYNGSRFYVLRSFRKNETLTLYCCLLYSVYRYTQYVIRSSIRPSITPPTSSSPHGVPTIRLPAVITLVIDLLNGVNDCRELGNTPVHA